MADNAQKTHLARTLNEFAQKKVLSAIHQLGKALPCAVVMAAGSIVQVTFEVANQPFTLPQVTMPTAGWQWARAPIQKGDMGVTMPAAAYLGGVSGLGGGVASLTLPANLSALVFVPVGNANWSAADDPNAWCIYGPNGAVIRDSGATTKVQVDGNGNVQIWGATSLSTDVHGYGQRLTWTGGSNFNSETWHNGANVTDVPDHGFSPPEIPSP